MRFSCVENEKGGRQHYDRYPSINLTSTLEFCKSQYINNNSQVLRSAENTARTILRILGCRPIQNEEIAVSSQQAAAVFSNPNYRASPVQILAQIARGNCYSDVNSLARTLCVEFTVHRRIGIDEVKSIMIMPNLWQISRRRRRITDWERGDLIGKGSFTSVYRGSNEDGLFFAAKGVSHKEYKSLCHLENEIAILEGLDHENIIQYYGTLNDGEMVYIFLELVSHGTLQQAYKNCRFKESQVSHYTRQILQGLKYLHSCNVVHGDLKCANILVTELGRIKLADFGLSKSMEDHSQSLKLGLGSPLWMAPEVAKLKRVWYGFPSDIWSLGCTVTELSTRKYPQYINGENPLKLDRAIRSGKGPLFLLISLIL
ncbi:hypothetical protein OIU77_002203 [Salix suchowensis]|uniref:Protein kinase domain-containing protein n=1 Tax=Salix suchowensis TaxID=1278906 RepID=A0ABQ9B3Z1_9ROSI|nr:hypothetical protein OIU77_002203 [Salix suchowensis]